MEKEQTIQVTSKDPKKIEAGKKLAAYNKKKREELKSATPQNDKKSETGDEQKSDNVVMSCCVGVLIVFAIGGGIYFYNKTSLSVSQPAAETITTATTPVKSNKFEME